jgi:hypothetical protein
MRGQIVGFQAFGEPFSVNRVCLVSVEVALRGEYICVLPQKTIQEALLKGGAITVAQGVEFMEIAGVYLITKVFAENMKRSSDELVP